jgi:hypothetical protein
MFTPKLCVVLPPADRAQLADVLANGNTPQKLAVRARILILLADHVRPSQVATRVGAEPQSRALLDASVCRAGRERRAA